MSYYTANTRLYETTTGTIGTSGIVLAFNAGDTVPDATVTANGLVAADLVTLQSGSGTPVVTTPVVMVGALSNGTAPIYNGTTHQFESGTVSYLSAATASATYKRPQLPSVVVDGDSIPLGNDGAGVFGGRVFMRHAAALLKQRVKVLGNFGVGGQTSAQILARLPTTIASGADVIVMHAGRNSLTNDAGATITQVTGDLTAMINLCRASGVDLVLDTIIPGDSGVLTGNQEIGRQNINAWIRNQDHGLRGVYVADMDAALTDPATGLAYSSALTDGTHPGYGAAAAMGRVLAAVLTERGLNGQPPLLNSESDANQLLAHGRFSAGGSGAAPTDWFHQGTAPTYSKVARTDGVRGTWQRLVVAAGGSLVFSQNRNVDGTMPVGTVVSFRVEFAASAVEQGLTSGQYLSATLGFYNGATFTNTVYTLSPGSGSENVVPFDRSGVLWTPSLAIPVGTTLVQASVNAGGGMTLDLDRADLRVGVNA